MSSQPGKHSCDVVMRCLEDQLSDTDALLLFQSFLVLGLDMISWTEPVIAILHRIVSVAPLEQADCHRFLEVLAAQVASFHANVRFAKLVQVLVAKHLAMFDTETTDMCVAVVNQLTTFMKKQLLKKLE